MTIIDWGSRKDAGFFYPMMASSGMDECLLIIIYIFLLHAMNSLSKGSCDMTSRNDINICCSSFSQILSCLNLSSGSTFFPSWIINCKYKLDIHIYIYIYMHINICTHMCIYIYTYTSKKSMHIYVHIDIYI